MNTEELLVHDGSEGECAERVHAGIIQALRVLAFACMRQRSEGSTLIANVQTHTQA